MKIKTTLENKIKYVFIFVLTSGVSHSFFVVAQRIIRNTGSGISNNNEFYGLEKR